MNALLTRCDLGLTAAGQKLERSYQGKDAHSPWAERRGWIVHVNGASLARDGSLECMQARLRESCEAATADG